MRWMLQGYKLKRYMLLLVIIERLAMLLRSLIRYGLWFTLVESNFKRLII